MKSILNELQIGKIADTVNESAIASAEMKEDLIDHLCCIVEDEMSKGKDFETVFQTVWKRFCTKGLNEIQHEEVFLKTSKQRKRLDLFIYISGYTALILTFATIMLQLFHLPGGSLFLLFSSLIIIFVFFPTIIIRFFKQLPGNKKIIPFIFGILGVWTLMLSAIFSILHFPGAMLFLLNSFVCIILSLMFFFKNFKKSR